MRSLLPDVSADVDLHRSYADGWVEDGGVRVNFIASVDGASSTAGKSGGLQTPGDNAVFATVRDLADVVLAGSGTVLTEGYGALSVSDRRKGIRREYGLAAELPLAVVSTSLHLDPDSDLFADAAPGARTIVLTAASADPGRRRALDAVADVITCGEDRVDPAAARRTLEARGLARILCEGGPSIFAEFAAAGVVDELCLTVSPMLAGPGPGRIVGGADSWSAPVGMSLATLFEEDGALFCRYRTATFGRPVRDLPTGRVTDSS